VAPDVLPAQPPLRHDECAGGGAVVVQIDRVSELPAQEPDLVPRGPCEAHVPAAVGVVAHVGPPASACGREACHHDREIVGIERSRALGLGSDDPGRERAHRPACGTRRRRSLAQSKCHSVLSFRVEWWTNEEGPGGCLPGLHDRRVEPPLMAQLASTARPQAREPSRALVHRQRRATDREITRALSYSIRLSVKTGTLAALAALRVDIPPPAPLVAESCALSV